MVALVSLTGCVTAPKTVTQSGRPEVFIKADITDIKTALIKEGYEEDNNKGTFIVDLNLDDVLKISRLPNMKKDGGLLPVFSGERMTIQYNFVKEQDGVRVFAKTFWWKADITKERFDEMCKRMAAVRDQLEKK